LPGGAFAVVAACATAGAGGAATAGADDEAAEFAGASSRDLFRGAGDKSAFSAAFESSGLREKSKHRFSDFGEDCVADAAFSFSLGEAEGALAALQLLPVLRACELLPPGGGVDEADEEEGADPTKLRRIAGTTPGARAFVPGAKAGLAVSAAAGPVPRCRMLSSRPPGLGPACAPPLGTRAEPVGVLSTCAFGGAGESEWPEREDELALESVPR